MGSGLAKLYLDEANLSTVLEDFGLKSSKTCCSDTSLTPASQSFPKNAVTCGLLSGNGNYENRKFPGAKANYLMSSTLALLLATAGKIDVELGEEIVLQSGKTLRISEIWPERSELIKFECHDVLPRVCAKVFKDFTKFSSQFEAIKYSASEPFPWDPNSLYILRPPYFEMKPGKFMISQRSKNV